MHVNLFQKHKYMLETDIELKTVFIYNIDLGSLY